MANSCSVAERIRKIRLDKEMTQTELAAKCNVTKSLICKIEANRASIHLELLLDIATSLGVTVSELLEETPQKTVTVVRVKERKKLVANHLGGKNGFDYYRLAGSKEARLEIFVLVISSDAVKTARFVEHEGFEFVYVLSGNLNMAFRDQESNLRPGDCAFFDASKAHRLIPHSCEVVELFCVFLYPKMTL